MIIEIEDSLSENDKYIWGSGTGDFYGKGFSDGIGNGAGFSKEPSGFGGGNGNGVGCEKGNGTGEDEIK